MYRYTAEAFASFTLESQNNILRQKETENIQTSYKKERHGAYDIIFHQKIY